MRQPEGRSVVKARELLCDTAGELRKGADASHGYVIEWVREGLAEVHDAALVLLATEPDQTLWRGEEEHEKPYIERWFLSARNVEGMERDYLHRFMKSDPDTPHDHPWPSRSWAIKGKARERWWRDGSQAHQVEPNVQRLLPGDRVIRPARHAHQIEVEEGIPFVTLFVTLAKEREWGFWENGQFVPWRVWTGEDDDLDPQRNKRRART